MFDGKKMSGEHKEIRNYLMPNYVLVSCANKDGLVSSDENNLKYPQEGILGKIQSFNPKVTFISSGETYKLIKSAGLNVMEISELTGFPNMENGLVKTLQTQLMLGILGGSREDYAFMTQNEIRPIDTVIVNFRSSYEYMKGIESFELLRSSFDIGGPTLCQCARKAFINTIILASTDEYKDFIGMLEENNGYISLEQRLELAKKASKEFTRLMNDVDRVVQEIEFEEVKKAYLIS